MTASVDDKTDPIKTLVTTDCGTSDYGSVTMVKQNKSNYADNAYTLTYLCKGLTRSFVVNYDGPCSPAKT